MAATAVDIVWRDPTDEVVWLWVFVPADSAEAFQAAARLLTAG